MNEHELIYLAGFFDGEGSVGVYNVGGKPTVALTVVGIHEDSVRRFHCAFGGSVSIIKESVERNTRQAYQWRVTGRRAVAALTAMFAWLTVKRPQAEAVITGWPTPIERLRDERGAYVPQPEQRAKQMAVRETLTRLNRRGVRSA